MNGVIILDKPSGFTSFDAVAVVRGLAKEKKIGHTGTLDPMATGVLPLLLGRAAKAASLLPDENKEYRAGFRLGERFDTGDITGALLEKDSTPVGREALEQALEGFRGKIMQVPPMYSAVSVNGQRLYKLARQGLEVERPARQVTICSLALESYDPIARQGTLVVSCSKGTYIRVLIEDIAQALGTCGTMCRLRRTAACGFTQEDAVSLERLQELAGQNQLDLAVQPVEVLFRKLGKVFITLAQAQRFCNGGSLDLGRVRLEKPAEDGARLCVYDPNQVFLGLAQVERETEQLRFLKLF